LKPAQAPGFKYRLRLKVLDPGLGAQLFEPMDNINDKYEGLPPNKTIFLNTFRYY